MVGLANLMAEPVTWVAFGMQFTLCRLTMHALLASVSHVLRPGVVSWLQRSLLLILRCKELQAKIEYEIWKQEQETSLVHPG